MFGGGSGSGAQVCHVMVLLFYRRELAAVDAADGTLENAKRFCIRDPRTWEPVVS